MEDAKVLKWPRLSGKRWLQIAAAATGFALTVVAYIVNTGEGGLNPVLILLWLFFMVPGMCLGALVGYRCDWTGNGSPQELYQVAAIGIFNATAFAYCAGVLGRASPLVTRHPGPKP